MQISKQRFAAWRSVVSAVFDRLALLEFVVSAAVLVGYLGQAFASWRMPERIGQGVMLAVLVCIVLQGAMLFGLRLAERRVPPELPPRPGYRGYQGGTPPRWSKRDRRRTLREMLQRGAAS